MTVRRFPPLLFLVGSLALLACNDDVTGFEEVQGLYDLMYVGQDLQRLPVLGAPNGSCPVLIDHGSVALDTSGRFSAMIDAGTTQCPNGDSNAAYWPDAGTYEVFGDSIEFDPDGSSARYSGRFTDANRRVLELHHPRGWYTYVRFR